MSKIVRLNKFLADAGICSRRKADELIEAGLVKVNGKTIAFLGAKVNVVEDKVTYKGKRVNTDNDKIYLAFHKPKNVVTTTSDPLDRPTIIEYFAKYKKHRLFPVGRLDWGTEGLIFMTNDGDFSNAVANPKSKLPKTYLAKLDGQISPAQIRKLMTGVTIVGGRVKALHAELVSHGGGSKKYDWVKIVITEGKNRQIRKMFEKVGFDVKKLTRIAIGNYKLGSLRVGMYRELTTQDLLKVFEKRPQKISSESQQKIRRPANKNSKR